MLSVDIFLGGDWCRNDYETRIGKFKGAVDPRTTAFREFPLWVDDQYQLSSLDSDAQVECKDSSDEAEMF